MHALLVATVLLGAPDVAAVPQEAVYSSLAQTASALAPAMQTGTLIASQGDCLAVKVFSQSPYTHVACVVLRDGKPFVYDSSNGHGVRCQTLKNYLKSQNPSEIHVFQPKKPFTTLQAQRFRKHLDSELGRPYAVKHHLTGDRTDGLHCAEYAIDALVATKLMKVNRAPKVSPGSLIRGVVQAERYDNAQTITLKELPPPQVADGWCSQLWLDTKTCTADCCRKMKGWILCR